MFVFGGLEWFRLCFHCFKGYLRASHTWSDSVVSDYTIFIVCNLIKRLLEVHKPIINSRPDFVVLHRAARVSRFPTTPLRSYPVLLVDTRQLGTKLTHVWTSDFSRLSSAFRFSLEKYTPKEFPWFRIFISYRIKFFGAAGVERSLSGNAPRRGSVGSMTQHIFVPQHFVFSNYRDSLIS